MAQPAFRLSKNAFRSAALVVATILLARAFVPVGYMVADGGNGIALYLCPEQTPEIYTWLDSDPRQNAHVHHGHRGDPTHGGAVEQSLAAYGDTSCMLWANGAHAAAISIADNGTDLVDAAELSPRTDQLHTGRRTYSSACPRAPPA